MMIFLLSCAAAGNAASAAAPPSAVPRAVRRLMMNAMQASLIEQFLGEHLLSEHLAGRRLPADIHRVSDLWREGTVAIGNLHHHTVAGRQAHMDVDQGAKVRDEFHRTGQAVVESGLA